MPSDSKTFDLLIRADAELNGLQQTEKELTQVARQMRALGQDSSAVEKELAGVEKQMASRTVELYGGHLREQISATKAAGEDTTMLEHRLEALAAAEVRAQSEARQTARALNELSIAARAAAEQERSAAAASNFSHAGGAQESLREGMRVFGDFPGTARASSSAVGGLSEAFGGVATKATAAFAAIEVGRKALGAVEDGVNFVTKLSDVEIGIANVVQRFQGLDKVASRNVAAEAIDKIIEIEPKAAGTLDDLVQGFVSTYGAAASAGLTIEQNVKLVGMFANALGNTNLPVSQLSQEMRSIVSESIGADSALARTLGITNEQIRASKESGQMYEFLAEKIGSLGETGNTSAVRMSSLSSAWDKLKGQVVVGLGLDKTWKGFVGSLQYMIDGVSSVLPPLREKTNHVTTATNQLGVAAQNAVNPLEDEKEALEGVTFAAERLDENFRNLDRRRNEKRNRADALTDAAQARDNAIIDESVKTKRITPEQGALAKANVDKQANMEKRDRQIADLTEQRDELERKQRMLESDAAYAERMVPLSANRPQAEANAKTARAASDKQARVNYMEVPSLNAEIENLAAIQYTDTTRRNVELRGLRRDAAGPVKPEVQAQQDLTQAASGAMQEAGRYAGGSGEAGAAVHAAQAVLQKGGNQQDEVTKLAYWLQQLIDHFTGPTAEKEKLKSLEAKVNSALTQIKNQR